MMGNEPTNGLSGDFFDSMEGEAAVPLSRNVERLRVLVSVSKSDFVF